MSDAPFVEKLVTPDADTEQSKAARQRLSAAMAELNPAGGKTDRDGNGPRNNNRARSSALPRAAGPWKSGDTLPSARAPYVAQKPLEISAEIEPAGSEGVVVTQGGAAHGYAIYLTQGKLAFAVREKGALTTIEAKDPLGNGHFLVQATLHEDGALALLVDGKQVAEGKAAGLIPQQPRAGFSVGSATGRGAVGNYAAANPFQGKVTNVCVKTIAVPEAAGQNVPH